MNYEDIFRQLVDDEKINACAGLWWDEISALDRTVHVDFDDVLADDWSYWSGCLWAIQENLKTYWGIVCDRMELAENDDDPIFLVRRLIIDQTKQWVILLKEDQKTTHLEVIMQIFGDDHGNLLTELLGGRAA